MSTIPIKKCDGIHENVESNSKEVKAISIRIPPLVHETRFKMVYDVVPDKTDRRFYTAVLFALIAVSLILFLISTKTFHGYENLIDLNSIYTLSHRIYSQVDTIFAGIVTVSLAAIGFMRSYSLNKTRFWFIIPVIISVLGFLFKKV